MKVKLIVEDTYTGLERAINDFIETKEVINISMSETRTVVSAIILYREDK